MWHIWWQGTGSTVRHSKGMLDLARLLENPEAEVHVIDLVDATGTGQAACGLARVRQ